MSKRNSIAAASSALALVVGAVTAPVALPFSAANAQAYSPMPPACQAASDAAQMEGNSYSQPPANISVIVQMQHILYLTGLLLDALDHSCRDWADYGRTRQQFEATYNATLENCRAIASDQSECRRKPYRG